MAADYRLFINRDLPPMERGCTSKVAFESRREARSRLSHGRFSNGGLRPYHCPRCEGWHLGHGRRREPLRLSATDGRGAQFLELH